MQELTYHESWSLADFKTKQGSDTVEVFENSNGRWFRCGQVTGTVSSKVEAGCDVKVSRVSNSERTFLLLHLNKSQKPLMSF